MFSQRFKCGSDTEEEVTAGSKGWDTFSQRRDSTWTGTRRMPRIFQLKKEGHARGNTTHRTGTRDIDPKVPSLLKAQDLGGESAQRISATRLREPPSLRWE